MTDSRLFRFVTDESGAVTVDWVVLTAAIVGLGIAVITTIGGGTDSLATEVASTFSGATLTLTLPTHGN